MSPRDRLESKYDQALNRLEDVKDSDRDLHDVGMAMVAVCYARLHLAQRVAQARANGRSWSQIAMVFGTSKQAVRERFGDN